jgi:GNAT superfamily N-acetyltransferase
VSGNLRFATPADAAAITELVNLAYRVEDFFKIGDRTDPEEVSALLGRDAFIVADGDGRELAGAVYVRATPPRGYFGMLSVQPALQGTGLGRKLIEAAERYCIEHGCTEMDLSVVNLRVELIPLYERLGYRQSGTERWPEAELHRISRPAHFITMTRRIEADAPAGR